MRVRRRRNALCANALAIARGLVAARRPRLVLRGPLRLRMSLRLHVCMRLVPRFRQRAGRRRGRHLRTLGS